MKDLDTHVAGFEMPMRAEQAQYTASTMEVSVRDMDGDKRSVWFFVHVDGTPALAAELDWNDFVEKFDTMRAGMYAENYDEALLQLMSSEYKEERE